MTEQCVVCGKDHDATRGPYCGFVCRSIDLDPDGFYGKAYWKKVRADHAAMCADDDDPADDEL